MIKIVDGIATRENGDAVHIEYCYDYANPERYGTKCDCPCGCNDKPNRFILCPTHLKLNQKETNVLR